MAKKLLRDVFFVKDIHSSERCDIQQLAPNTDIIQLSFEIANRIHPKTEDITRDARKLDQWAILIQNTGGIIWQQLLRGEIVEARGFIYFKASLRGTP